MLAGALTVGQAWLLARVIALAFIEGATLGAVEPWLAALVAAAAAKAVCTWRSQVYAARAASLVRVALRVRLTQRLLDGGPALATDERTGELTNTLVGGLESTDAYVRSYLPQVVQAWAVPLVIVLAVGAADPLSALVLVLTYPLIPLFMYLIGDVARARTRRQWVTLSRMSARFLDAIQGLTTLKAFGRSADEAAVIARAMGRFRSVTMSVLRVAFLSALVLELLATLGTAIVAVEVGLRLLYGRVEFGAALFVLVLAPEFYRPLRALGAAFHSGMAGREVATRLSALLDSAPAATAGDRSGRVADSPATTPSVAGAPRRDVPYRPPAIEFEDVRFCYTADRRPALDGFDLSVGAGTTVALVGPSGAGKSTVFGILLRFLEAGRGRVLVDGHDLRTFDREVWRQRVAWVSQRPHIFDGSLADNLLIARPGASVRELDDALRLAQADGLVARLSQGLQTPVGTRGERLSGGEAQRLALARAFLKDAPLVLLDEPTAQLDPSTESIVTEAMSRLCEGRTVLLIAHRLTTSASAGRIVLMDQGRVLEQGSHAALLASGGRYARLVDAYGGAP